MSDCDKCGCDHLELVSAGERLGRPFAVYQCQHCGHLVREGGLAGSLKQVSVTALRCPSCGAKRPPVQRTVENTPQRIRRHHRCEVCGHNFYSVEK